MNRLFLRLLLLATLATIGSSWLMFILLENRIARRENHALEETLRDSLTDIAARIDGGASPEAVFSDYRADIGNTLALLDADLVPLDDADRQRLAAGAVVVDGTGLRRSAYVAVPAQDAAVELMLMSIKTLHAQWAPLATTEDSAPLAEALSPLDQARLRWHPIVRRDGTVVRQTDSGPVVSSPPRLTNARMLGYLVTVLTLAPAIWISLVPIQRQLVALSRGAARLRDGDLSTRVPVHPRNPGPIDAVSMQVNAMAERVQDLIESHEELMRSASHELQTPLARLLFFLDALEAEPDQRAALITGMRDTTEEMRQLAEEILTFNRLGRGQGHLIERVELDLAELVEDIALSTEGARAEVPDAPLLIEADPRLLYRALRNLTENALAYATPPVLRVEPAPDAIAIHVDDAGPGVPPSERDPLFAPFYRMEGSRDRRHGGTGLGLAIVQRVAERHGGRCTITDSPEGGARFTLWLPLSGPAGGSSGPANAPGTTS